MTKINHNSTNLDGYHELMKKRNALMEQQKLLEQSNNIKSNLEDWLISIPAEFKNVKLQAFSKNALMPIKPSLLSNKMPYRLLVAGNSKYKEAFVYGLLRYAIAKGIIIPSEIRISGVYEGSAAVTGGFKKQAWRDNFFDTDANIFIIKGLSHQYSDINDTGANKFLAQFSQFIRENNKQAIFIYDTNVKEENLINSGKPWVPYLSSNRSVIANLLTRDYTLTYLGANALRHKK